MGDLEDLGARDDELSRLAGELTQVAAAIEKDASASPVSPLDWPAFKSALAAQSALLAEKRLKLGFAGGAMHIDPESLTSWDEIVPVPPEAPEELLRSLDAVVGVGGAEALSEAELTRL